MRKKHIIFLLLIISIFTFARTPKPEKALWKNSKQYFKRHSYKKALSSVEQLLKYYPKSKHRLKAKIIKGKSLIKLRNYNKGLTYLVKLLKQHKKLNRRADLMEFMGDGYQKWNSYSYGNKAIIYYKKAISLYLSKKKNKKAISIYYNLIKVYKNYNYHKEYPNKYQERYHAKDRDIIKSYNAIIRFARDKDTKVTAYYNKATYIRDYFYYNKKKKELAIKAFKKVIKYYRKHNLAALSQFEIAKLYNSHGEYVTALKEYKKFIKSYANHHKVKNAKKMIQSIKNPLISLRVQSTVKPGDKTKLTWSIRNVSVISFSAYKVDLFKVLKKVERLYEINKYSVKEIKAAKKWKFETPNRGKYKYHYSNSISDGKVNPLVEVPITKSGAYIIKGYGENRNGKGYEVTTLILISKLGLITKAGKEKNLFYTVNSITGKPIKNTKILVQRLVKTTSFFGRTHYEYNYDDLKTNQRGIVTYKSDTDSTKSYWNRNLVVLSKYNDDYAVSGSRYSYYWYGYRRNFKIYGYTDRPVYRPNQKVSFKQIIRKYQKGEYLNYTDESVHVLITDPKGNKLFDKTLTTNQFGSISGSIQLADKPPLGVYRIRVQVSGENYNYWVSRGNQFRVEEYKKPEYKVTITTKKPTYKIGDRITFKILSKYYFGSPVVNADVEYTIYKKQYNHFYRPFRKYSWFYDNSFYNRWASRGFGYKHRYYYRHRRELVTKGKLKSDQKGEIYVSVKSKHFKHAEHSDIRYIVEAKVVDKSRREIRGYGDVKVTNKPFYIYLNPVRYLYEKNETAKIKVTARNPNNQSVSFNGIVKVYPVEYIKKQNKNKSFYTIERLGQVALVKKLFVSSRADKVFKFKLRREGYFKVIITSKDNDAEKITGSCYLWIAQKKSEFDHYRYKDIEIIIDKDTYLMGETARVLINTRHKDSYVLLTAEADDIYYHKVVFIKGKSKLVKLPITQSLSPNVWLTASTFRANKLYKDSMEVIVPPEHKYLDVKIIAPKQTFKPQETVEFTVITKNHKGKGVQSEFSLGFVDSSIYYIQSEYREDIRKFFYGRKRYHRVKTSTGYDYRHYGRGHFAQRRSSKNGLGDAMDKEVSEEDASPTTANGKASSPKSSKKMKARAKLGLRKPDSGKKQQDFKEARVRKDFPDTMFWNAHIKTNSKGIAKIKIKFPDTLTTWKISSTAITKESDVGVYNLNVITRKNLIVRLQAPRFFQEKDIVYVSGIVHNYLDSDKTALVKLKVTDQLGISRLITEKGSSKEYHPLKQEISKEIQVPKNGEKRVDFVIRVIKKRITPVNQKDMATVTVSALTDEESDAMQLKFPVLEYGVEKFVAQNGILNTKKKETRVNISFNIPKAIKPGTQEIKVILNPSIASVMIDALPYLISYPYGCVEQTMSRFLPTVVTQNTLKKLDISLEELADRYKNKFKYLKKSPIYNTSEMNKMVNAGLDKLYGYQHSDGGWGWWKNDHSNPYMSAYVVYGLYTASQSGVNVRQSVINSGIRFLEGRLTSGEKINRYSWYSDDDNVRTYMLYTISLASSERFNNSKKLKKSLTKIWSNRDDLNEYSKTLLALTQHHIGDKKKAEIMLENLEDFIKVNDELNTANFQDIKRYWYWYDNGLESTTFALKAYLKIKPESKYIPMMVKWLVRNRKGKRWFSTKDTAFVVYALAEYMTTTDELNPNLTVNISYGDNFKKSYKVTKKNIIFGYPEFTIPSQVAGTGKHKLKIDINGRGKIYYSTYLKYFTKEDPIKGAGHEIYIKRNYFKLTPKQVTRYRREWNSQKRKYVQVAYKDTAFDKKTLKFGDHLKSGDLIEVVLSIKANNNFEYLMFEDPKPAGCEPTQLKSGSTYQGGFVSNMELRDTMVSFFVTYLKQGKHTIRYKLRAEIPGAFNVMPSQSQAMYAPSVRGISDSWKMNITETAIN